MTQQLANWKSASATRDVTIVSGDAHVGGETTVRLNGVTFKQHITSPIANGTPSRFQRCVAELGMDMLHLKTGSVGPIRFRHELWITSCNVGHMDSRSFRFVHVEDADAPVRGLRERLWKAVRSGLCCRCCRTGDS